jgi:hypothetical protein
MAKRKLAPEDVGKLQKCLEVRGASERAVHDIWNICHDEDKKITRGTFERNVEQGKEAWLAVTEAVTFSCHDGSDVALPIVDLRKYLQKMCSEVPAWRSALETALSQNRSLSPVLFCDECTSGNVLAVNKVRKANLYHLSWLELWHLLKNQNAWVPLTCVQSQCLSKIKGGASRVMIEILKRVLTPENEQGFRLNDMVFRQRRKAKFVADLEAVRSVYSVKGSAGLRCCILCRNVVKKDSGVPCHDNYFVEISSAGGFIDATNDDIFQQCDRMMAPCTRKAMDAQEIATGITFDPETLLWSPVRTLMPPSEIIYDVMHVYLINGIASWEVHLLANKVYECTRVTRESFQSAVMASQWKGMKSSGKTENYIKNLFEERMFGESLFKGQAHQTSSIVPLIRYYMEELFERSLPEFVCKSFKCLGNIVKFIREVQNGLVAIDERTRTHLDKLQRMHHIYFGKAYGEDEYRPKHHHRHHLPLQWLRAGVPVTCESLESKHSLYKLGVGDHQKSLVHDHGKFSSSVLTKMLQTNCALLQKTGLPFWELLPPISEATMDDKIFFLSMELKTSKSRWDLALYFQNSVFVA